MITQILIRGQGEEFPHVPLKFNLLIQTFTPSAFVFFKICGSAENHSGWLIFSTADTMILKV
jgi:hypothetical protein